jgi:hypothetical protein
MRTIKIMREYVQANVGGHTQATELQNQLPLFKNMFFDLKREQI